jgi:histone-lysine N-methyltransferase SETMAR
MIRIFFTGGKLIVLDILPKGNKFNGLYFVEYIFPDLKRGNAIFHRRIPQATFWIHVHNSTFHHGLRLASKFEDHHVSRSLHSPYSLDISPCDFCLFGMLKRVLKDREFDSSDEIEEEITKIWDGLTFDEAHSVFHNWMSRLAWVIENGREYITE